MVLSWVNELSAAIASSGRQRPATRCEIRFRVGSQTFGLDVATGAVTDGLGATSEIAGEEEAFNAIMCGDETLQSAYRAGAIHLSGDPEPFLRLAMLIDRYAASRVCVQ
jgi:hypothetical protein